jgi:hypothetical protein
MQTLYAFEQFLFFLLSFVTSLEIILSSFEFLLSTFERKGIKRTLSLRVFVVLSFQNRKVKWCRVKVLKLLFLGGQKMDYKSP